MRKYGTIMLIGAGGVGVPLSIFLGNVCETLVIVDHDVYEQHNMSRQPIAKGNVGMSKVNCIERAITSIVSAQVAGIEEKFTTDNGDELFDHFKPDLICIAVDNDEARKAIWPYRDRCDILWAANEVWDPQCGLSLKEKPWNPMDCFKAAETVEHPICGQQSIHANCAAASMAAYLLMCHLTEDGPQPAFMSKAAGQPLFPIPLDELIS